MYSILPILYNYTITKLLFKPNCYFWQFPQGEGKQRPDIAIIKWLVHIEETSYRENITSLLALTNTKDFEGN